MGNSNYWLEKLMGKAWKDTTDVNWEHKFGKQLGSWGYER
jgi:V8-like Glu-specific endopeptidase